MKLDKICGTCIAKNKIRHTVSLLTINGVVDIKLRKEMFAYFDKRISAKGADGVKHVLESSWFNRGEMLVVQGMRSGDEFVAKKYGNNSHELYKIVKIDDDGDLILQDSRVQGESDGEE